MTAVLEWAGDDAVPVPAPVIQSVPVLPPPLPPAPTAPPAPPPPPAPVVSKAAGAKGNPANWITNDDYPSRALRDEGLENRRRAATSRVRCTAERHFAFRSSSGFCRSADNPVPLHFPGVK